MIFGSKEEPAAGHGEENGEHASVPAQGHGAAEHAPAAHGAAAEGGHAPEATKAADDHGAAKSATAEHGAEAEAGHSAPAVKADGAHDVPKASEPVAEGQATAAATDDDHGEQAAKPAEDEKPAEAAHAGKPAEAEQPAEEQGFMDQVKGMILGGPSDEADGAHEEAKADAGHEAQQASGQAHEPAPEPRTSAEGGKRWSNSSEKDEIRSDEAVTGNDAAEAEHADAKPTAEGPSEADAAGAAWLEKFRAQQGAPAAEGAKH
jgi:hypothetical protein